MPFNNERRKVRFDIASEAKRGVAAVFLFALAALIVLGFFDKAGLVGIKLNIWTSLALGWGKLVFPVFLLVAGIILLFRKQTSFYIFKIIGLILMLGGISGFFHWFTDPPEMLELAKIGLGGGYFGYAVAFFSIKYLSQSGAMVIIAALFIAGLILAFNFSPVEMFKKLREEGKKEAEKRAAEELAGQKGELLAAKKVEAEKGNIGKVEFVEGPDQFVDEKLLAAGLQSARKFKKPGEKEEGKPAATETGWEFPPLDSLEKQSGKAKGGDVEKNAEIIQKTFKDFGIDVALGEIKTGPSVTQYSFRPAVGVKVAKILSMQNDLALALAKHPIRIEAPIPGKSLIGVEVPNDIPTLVRLRDFMESIDFVERKSNLMLALGEDVNGDFIFADLAKMPHLLVAGATGSGKSVCINTLILSLLYQNSPDDLKFILVDPKRVELSLYNGIPHLLTSTIVENGKVVGALKWAVAEMENRYRLLQDMASKDIVSYNEKVKEGKKRRFIDPETKETIEEEVHKLPYIIIIIDELADLMGSHGKEVEGAVVRVAQMARAVGIHLIVSTQRPEVKVITGLIKANITSRVAFQVATQIDSRTIIDMAGADKLLGNGDMLYLSAASPKPQRIQGVFVSESEVKRVVKFIRGQKVERGEELGEEITKEVKQETFDFQNVDETGEEDSLYEAAKTEVMRAGKASASLLQRRLRVGYARAARLLDVLEANGIIGPPDGAKPREVYLKEGEPGYESPMEDQIERDKWNM